MSGPANPATIFSDNEGVASEVAVAVRLDGTGLVEIEIAVPGDGEGHAPGTTWLLSMGADATAPLLAERLNRAARAAQVGVT